MENLVNVCNCITARFLWWSVFSTVAPLTLAKFRSLGFEFSQQLLGLQAKTPRWKGCTSNVNANFGLALSYLYIKSHFDKRHRDKVHHTKLLFVCLLIYILSVYYVMLLLNVYIIIIFSEKPSYVRLYVVSYFS